jgi:aspartate kinase
VVTGFIAATETGQPTTLGRGGSDYTASILAVCAEASEVWMWTDVDGIMTTDPDEVPNAVNIPHLSYDEVAELAYFGARILHARMIGPLRDYKIVLRIKNIFKPRADGTLISQSAARSSQPIKAVTSIQGISLNAEFSGPLTSITNLIDKTLVATTGNHTEVMLSSQSSTHSFIGFVIPTTINPEALRTTQLELKQQLQESAADPAWEVSMASVVTVVGTQMQQFSPQMTRLLQSLENISIQALAQGPGGNSLSLVVSLEDAEAALTAIHNCIVNSD